MCLIKRLLSHGRCHQRQIDKPLVSHRLCKHYFVSDCNISTGSNSLWQHALSFPVVEGADSFYNQLAGINSTYTPEDKQGTDIGKRKDIMHVTHTEHTLTHSHTHTLTHTHTHTHTYTNTCNWSPPYGLYRHRHRNGKGGTVSSI